MIGPLGYGRSGESPWLWLIIIGGGVCLYVWGRLRGWPRVRRWADVADRLYLVGAPWWLQALFLAIIGGGSLYHLASGHYRWYWWFLPAVAWLAFAEVVVKRKRAGLSVSQSDFSFPSCPPFLARTYPSSFITPAERNVRHAQHLRARV